MLIPGISSVNLKKKGSLQMLLKVWRWRDYLGFSMWSLKAITSVLAREAEDFPHAEEGEAV